MNQHTIQYSFHSSYLEDWCNGDIPSINPLKNARFMRYTSGYYYKY